MFTGIVEEVGSVRNIIGGSHAKTIEIDASVVLEGTHIGDSISVNGVCLTVTALDRDSFSADVMHETLNRSSLKSLNKGSRVNLERAMAADGRFGGHIVSGHIDDTCIVDRIEADSNARWFHLKTDRKWLPYIVEKGSVALDGVSLTVAKTTVDGFAVSLIPHSRSHTTFEIKKVGDVVNLEVDIVGKYVQSLFPGYSDKRNENDAGLQVGGGISEGFLSENGFL